MTTNGHLPAGRDEMEGDVETLFRSHKGRGRDCCARFLIVTILSFTALLALSVMLQLLSFTPISSSPRMISNNHDTDQRMISSTHKSCGDTPETALARNCTFDLLSFSWLPWECYDDTLTSEFLEYNWSWYRLASSAHGTISPDKLTHVSQEVAFLGNETQLYVSFEYHIVHCIYMWRKLHRGLEMERLHLKPGSASGAWLDSYVSEFSHTNHCSMVLLEFVDNISSSKRSISASEHHHPVPTHEAMDEINVTIFTKYPICYPVPPKE